MFNRLRALVTRTSTYGGIRVPDKKGRFAPHEKAPNVQALETVCAPGDSVVCIGGGHGVTPTHAARAVGPSGNVVVYEGGLEPAELLRDVFEYNNVEQVAEVRHAIVGDAIDLYGTHSAETVSPEDLPACDVLELDCEGSEKNILEHIGPRPRAIVVETHPAFGSTTDEITALVHDLGYEIVASAPDSIDGDVLTCVRRP